MPRGKRRGGGRGGMAGISVRLKPGIRSAKEIEDGISSIPTVTWDPFTVLPKEIYSKIFNKLEDPTDKMNFMNAHVKFYDLFKAERVKFLLGKVFGDLTLDEKKKKEGKRWMKTDKNKIGLRLVCREWDRGIQNYYQLHPSRFQLRIIEDEWVVESNLKEQYANGYLLNCRQRYPNQTLHLHTLPIYRNLMTDMEQFLASHPPSKNPFLMGKINIQLRDHHILYRILRLDDEEGFHPQPLWSQVDNLLDNYGQHIWHFCFRARDTLLNQELLSGILQWLQLMPELRTLQLEFGYTTTPLPLNEIQLGLPQLRKLQTLHVSNFPPSAKLLEGMSALEKLEVASMSQLLNYQFPESLTELALQLENYEDIEDLKKLGQFQSLHKLIISLECTCVKNDSMDSAESSWKTIWMAIEEKFPALEQLQLTLPIIQVDRIRQKMLEQSLDCRLNLKKLKRLSLTLPTLSSLDFLQEIKTLQELKIKLKYYFREEFQGCDEVRRERVQFNRDLGTLRKSNIWKIFPNLKKLSIHDFGSVQSGSVKDYYSYEKRAGGVKITN